MFGQVRWKDLFDRNSQDNRLWYFVVVRVADLDACGWVYNILLVEVIKW